MTGKGGLLEDWTEAETEVVEVTIRKVVVIVWVGLEIEKEVDVNFEI